MNINTGLGMTVVGALIMAGCAATGELADKPVQLQADQGIAAIVLDAPNRITQITFMAKDAGGINFEVPDTRGGPSLYLVPVKAGRYCLKHFRYWRVIFDAKQDLGCFTVIAGHITYTGDLVPSPGTFSNDATTDQEFIPTTFADMLHQQYPVLAGRYPMASAPMPPAGVDATPATDILSTWVENMSGSIGQAIYVQNNSSWTVEISDFNLTGCINTKPACGSRQLDVAIGPFARKRLIVVGPVDAHAAYAYRYNYHYQNVD